MVKGCAGLGNRLVTVMAAINYCKSNNRTLIVDWADGQFDVTSENAFDKCFYIDDSIEQSSINEIENWDTLSHSSSLFKVNKNKGVYDLYFEKESSFFNRFPIRLFPKGRSRMLRKKWVPKTGHGTALCFGADLSDNLSSEVVYFVDFLPVISYEDMPGYIHLLPGIKEEIDQLALQYQLKSAIGVHVRFTDKKPTTQLKVLIKHLKERRAERIFLATDSTYIEELFTKEFENIVLYPKIKPKLSGEGLHQWALYKKDEKKKFQIYKESVIEMFLLSKCQRLLYQGNSTFSKISKVYHQNKNECLDWQKI